MWLGDTRKVSNKRHRWSLPQVPVAATFARDLGAEDDGGSFDHVFCCPIDGS